MQKSCLCFLTARLQLCSLSEEQSWNLFDCPCMQGTWFTKHVGYNFDIHGLQEHQIDLFRLYTGLQFGVLFLGFFPPKSLQVLMSSKTASRAS